MVFYIPSNQMQYDKSLNIFYISSIMRFLHYTLSMFVCLFVCLALIPYSSPDLFVSCSVIYFFLKNPYHRFRSFSSLPHFLLISLLISSSSPNVLIISSGALHLHLISESDPFQLLRIYSSYPPHILLTYASTPSHGLLISS